MGGFDEGFTSCGRADGEGPHRPWLRGAPFAYVPTPLAWHDGPEWIDAEDADDAVGRTSQKTRETHVVADARRLPESPRLAFASRRAGIRVTVCSMVSDAAIIASVESILRVIPTAHIVVADESAGLFAADVRGIPESDAAAGTVLATRFDPVRINR